MTSTGYRQVRPGMLAQQTPKEEFLPWLLGAASVFLIVLSPASLSPTIPLALEMKYFRVILTVLIVGVGLMFAKPRFGPHSAMVVPFIIFFSAAVLWADDFNQAIVKKAFFPLSFFSGLIVVICLKSLKGVEDLIGKFAIVSSIVAGFVVFVYLRDPNANTHHGRIALEGINANHLAETAAPLFIIAFYASQSAEQRSRKLKLYVTLVLVALVVLFTGSRASMLEMMVGCSVLLLRRFRFSTLATGALLVCLIGLAYFTFAESIGINFSRFLSTEDTRTNVWKLGLQKFLKDDSLLLGSGWAHNPYTMGSVNYLSIYISILIESGIVGSVIFLVCLGSLIFNQYSTLGKISRISSRANPEIQRRLAKLDTFCMCAFGLTLAILAHGLFESSTVLGSTVNSFAFGLAVGLGDQCRRFLKHYGHVA